MANKYMAREDAPFGDDVWAKLDDAMVQAARGELVGRRLLDIEGPFGLGLKAVPLPDEEEESGLVASGMLPLGLIQEPFTLGTRDLAGYERDTTALSTHPVMEAALAVARQEDRLIFEGGAGGAGLLTVGDVHEQTLSDWGEVGTAADDIIQAVTTLDDAGFHGPYALALAPERYNLLLRLYERGNRSEIEHVKTIVTEGVVKAPAMEGGGVMMASGRQYASIVLGQDMTIGFIGPAGSKVEFMISESLALRIRQPGAICVLNG